MNEDERRREESVEELIGQEWGQMVESDSERLDGLEGEVLRQISDKRGLNPRRWVKRTVEKLSSVYHSFSRSQRLAVGSAVFASVTAGLVLGLFVAPMLQTGEKATVFKVQAADAQSVELVGGFSGFKPVAMKDKDGDGIWTARLKLEDGVYEYYYLINGTEKAEFYPNADGVVRDWDNSKNGLIVVGENGEEKEDGPHQPSA